MVRTAESAADTKAAAASTKQIATKTLNPLALMVPPRMAFLPVLGRALRRYFLSNGQMTK
jgi:hypothetical protein